MPICITASLRRQHKIDLCVKPLPQDGRGFSVYLETIWGLYKIYKKNDSYVSKNAILYYCFMDFWMNGLDSQGARHIRH